jgi:polyphosphate kinase 2 (PPK2 family)
MLSRTAVDLLLIEIFMPVCYFLFNRGWLPESWWHPVSFFIFVAILRAVAPFAASFQGSRVGRVLTRSFFRAFKHRWLPVQRVEMLNLLSDDCCERDEISDTADLAKLGRKVAKALGQAQHIGVDGLRGQREALAAESFHQVGAGSGGYAVYECKRRVWSRNTSERGEFMTILLHVTPYGPSILDVMPRYVVLEFEDSVDRRNRWSEFLSKQIFEGPPVVEGYCYNGAFFSPYHFAELKTTYDNQWLSYENACKAMCKPRTGKCPNPPSDLLSLKACLSEGKRPRTRKKNAREERRLNAEITKVADELKKMMCRGKENGTCVAPIGVILYFEGLDCAGKSSTGGLLEKALQQAGYKVDMRQYNRPPTPEQKLRPWMDRFEHPNTTVALAVKNGSAEEETATRKRFMEKCLDHGHTALVWDRGPAGDFVYNQEFREMPMDERRERYREFMEFDRQCFNDKILFLKLLFVTNRDSIASTLGKRLAQKKMARDLRTWLKSSRGDESEYGEIGFEGLDEIEAHIDPTDFVAFVCTQISLCLWLFDIRCTGACSYFCLVVFFLVTHRTATKRIFAFSQTSL